jgi:predicted phage terminase large subunit-like protein
MLEADFAQIRQKATEDPLYLGHRILGYDYLETPADFHKEAALAVKAERDFLFLAPRNHIKTTLVDVVGTIFHLLRRPNDRVLLAASTVANAGLVLREITNHFHRNVRFRNVFPEFCPQLKQEEGNAHEFTIPCRTRHPKEASIEIAGEDTKITGRHYDVIRCTDLVVKENVPPWADPKQQIQTIEWFRTTSALLDTTNPRAHRTVDGTRWTCDDLYGEIIQNPGYAHFQQIVVGIKEDEAGDPIPVWSKMPVETLKRLRAECGQALWAANYKNSPMPEGANTFQRDWFKPYDTEANGWPVGETLLDVAITVDLAISDKDGADYTAIVVSGLSPANKLYVLSAHKGRWTPYETIDRLFAMQALWNPRYVGVESVAWQKAMLYMLDQEMRTRGIVMPVRALIPDGRKERRAWPLLNHAERFGIFVKPEHGVLVEECCRFPTGQHDDFVDALAYRGQDLLAPYREMQEQIAIMLEAPQTPKLLGSDLMESIEDRQMLLEMSPWELMETGDN